MMSEYDWSLRSVSNSSWTAGLGNFLINAEYFVLWSELSLPEMFLTISPKWSTFAMLEWHAMWAASFSSAIFSVLSTCLLEQPTSNNVFAEDNLAAFCLCFVVAACLCKSAWCALISHLQCLQNAFVASPATDCIYGLSMGSFSHSLLYCFPYFSHLPMVKKKISQLKSSPICGKEQPSEKKSNSCQKVAQFVV